MCGIVGYVGDKEAAPILVSGLCNLQYRGYDSAGVALCTADGVRTLKCVGSPENLIPKLASCADCSALCGVGHTRWATHGKPDVVNAHPHSCGRFHVVHNGIIENEKALKEEYFPNTEFLSHTDYTLKKNCYESVYGKELTYTFENSDIAGWKGAL